MPNVSDPLPRPSRLNLVGWCVCCGGWQCQSARCIQAYEDTHWGLCTDCYGSQNLLTKGWCLCTNGLVEYPSHEAAVQSYDDLDVLAPAVDQDESWGFAVVVAA
jgi:hypothetical protein